MPLLERAGHKVEAPDLPGHGDDTTPTREVSLKAYVDRVCGILDAESEPVVLVGHSMGGIVITQAAEYRPARIRTLVYVAAFLLRNGESLVEVAQTDTNALVMPNLVMSEDQTHATVGDGKIKEAFYGDCSDQDVARARSLLVPQALAPFATPMTTTEENFGRVPRLYVECLGDRAISPSVQKTMYTATPCPKVISMNTSHSPFFSAPEELASHLTSFDLSLTAR